MTEGETVFTNRPISQLNRKGYPLLVPSAKFTHYAQLVNVIGM